MKTSLLVVSTLSIVALAGCNRAPEGSASTDQEVERRVQERLAAEHQAEADRKLQEREAQLANKQQELAERERATQKAEADLVRRTRSEREAQEANQAQAAQEQRRREAELQDGRERSTVPQSYDLFYSKLDQDGDWIQTDTYGYVWQPQVGTDDPSWRPYTDGHWAYTDYGWTWVSNERFGWATYHYGRWTRLRGLGWVWVPGDEWAPAWVAWRSSDEFVGWAPLPPETHFERQRGIRETVDTTSDIGPDQYVFVSTSRFGERSLRRAAVGPERNVTIVNQTQNVTNITYNSTKTVIVNQGPQYEQLRQRSQQPVERLTIERRPTAELGAAVVSQGRLEVSAPVIRQQPQNSGRPHRVKATVTQVQADHGWSGVSEVQAQELREKVQRETEVPPQKPSDLPAPSPIRSAATPAAPSSLQNAPESTPNRRPNAPIPDTRSVRPRTLIPTPTPVPSPISIAPEQTPIHQRTTPVLKPIPVPPESTPAILPNSPPAAPKLRPFPSEAAPLPPKGKHDKLPVPQEPGLSSRGPALQPPTSPANEPSPFTEKQPKGAKDKHKKEPKGMSPESAATPE